MISCFFCLSKDKSFAVIIAKLWKNESFAIITAKLDNNKNIMYNDIGDEKC